MSDEWGRDPAGLAALLPSKSRVGVTSAAFSIEGGIRDDGRGESTWDLFMAQTGRIADGSDASVAADSYHRVDEDIASVSELGADSYRFSLAWPRLQPGGRGLVNRSAIAYYDRLIDGLLTRGIRPVATLFHWDTPQPLQHLGGWLNRDTASRFADYAHLAGEAFGDRVGAWVTVDQPSVVVWRGYGDGTHAPGATYGLGALPAAFGLLRGHGLAIEALRAADVVAPVGLVNAHALVEPASDSADDAARADLYDLLHHRLFADPVLLGRWPTPPEELAHLLPDFGDLDPAELGIASRPIDFYGVDLGRPVRIRGGGTIPTATSAAASVIDSVGPLLRGLADRHPDAPPITVTIGATQPDAVDARGEVDDSSRIRELAGAIAAVVTSGAGVAGVDIRSLLDGWEWDAGYTTPYGLVRVDRRTLARTPKASYRFLQQVLSARSGG